MHQRLLVAGSNSGHQLGLGHDEDAKVLCEALCSAVGDEAATPSTFPPSGLTVVQLSSGANHTVALLEAVTPSDEGTAKTRKRQRQLWAAGSGREGQLGELILTSGKTLTTFQRLDLESILGLNFGAFRLLDRYEPNFVVSGWNCTYLVLTPIEEDGISRDSSADVMLTLGLLNHNAFGEIGVAPIQEQAVSNACAHLVSFEKVITEHGFSSQAPYRIRGVAAGLRHALAELQMGPGSEGSSRTIVVGWGSARHGQVGTVPKAETTSTSKRTRPGPAPAIAHVPQTIVSWTRRTTEISPSLLRAGRDHSVVLRQTEEGKRLVQCFGSNRQGQCVPVGALLREDVADDEIESMSCNWNSTLILVRQRHVGRQVILGCGGNARGQLGSGSTESSSTPADPGLARVSLQGIEAALGSPISTPGTLHPDSPPSSIRIHKMVSGSEHSLLLVDRQPASSQEASVASGSDLGSGLARQVWGWGWNEHGNLAQGCHDEADRHVPVSILPGSQIHSSKSYEPVDIWAGFGTTFILANIR